MSISIDLAGRRALVTGASSGLGAHFARTLARAGASVVVAARRAEALEEIAASIRTDGGLVEAMLLDVADAAMVADVIDAAGSFDILVNNAGVVREGAVLDITEADWDAVIDTNLKGMFLVAQAVARGMREAGGGAIVNIASILGLRQGGGVLPYAVSKAGVIQMTKVMALELARFGIRVNAIAPGYMATDLNGDFWETDAGKALIRRIPMRRLGRIEELDLPLLMLVADTAGYMTGSVVAVDGGHLVSGL